MFWALFAICPTFMPFFEQIFPDWALVDNYLRKFSYEKKTKWGWGPYEKNFFAYLHDLDQLKINFCQPIPKMSFEKIECKKSIDLIKQSADTCFNDERRFDDPNNWRIAGIVCIIHIGLPAWINILPNGGVSK